MIGFFTYDLIEGRERLMPWRTIIEVCKEFQNSHNKKVTIYSLDCIPKNRSRIFQSIKIYSVDKKFVRQKNFFKINKFSSVFFPVVWRTSYNSIKYLISFISIHPSDLILTERPRPTKFVFCLLTKIRLFLHCRGTQSATVVVKREEGDKWFIVL